MYTRCIIYGGTGSLELDYSKLVRDQNNHHNQCRKKLICIMNLAWNIVKTVIARHAWFMKQNYRILTVIKNHHLTTWSRNVVRNRNHKTLITCHNIVQSTSIFCSVRFCANAIQNIIWTKGDKCGDFSSNKKRHTTSPKQNLKPSKSTTNTSTDIYTTSLNQNNRSRINHKKTI